MFSTSGQQDEVYENAPPCQEAVEGGFCHGVCTARQAAVFTMTSFYEEAARDIFKELDTVRSF